MGHVAGGLHSKGRVMKPRRSENDHREKGYINQAAPAPNNRNSRKDHAAYLMRSTVLRRARAPSAIETNSANRIIAQKWLSISTAASISASPTGGDFMGVESGDQVHDTRRCDESRAVISRCSRYVRATPFEYPSEQVKNPRRSIRQKSQRPERIRRPRRKYVSPQVVTNYREPADGNEKHDCSSGAAQKKMAESGYKPRCDRNRKRTGSIRSRGACCSRFRFVRFRRRKRFVVRNFVQRHLRRAAEEFLPGSRPSRALRARRHRH
jgi:hypothetical protein